MGSLSALLCLFVVSVRIAQGVLVLERPVSESRRAPSWPGQYQVHKHFPVVQLISCPSIDIASSGEAALDVQCCQSDW